MMFREGNQLKKDLFFDKAAGVKLHTNMFEYRKPTILDISPVESVLLGTCVATQPVAPTHQPLPGKYARHYLRDTKCHRHMGRSAGHTG